MQIPIYQPCLLGNEKHYVGECLETNWISSKGRFIGEFEESFCRFTGSRHAVSVCNGTVALHLALVALGIGNGDEVIVPTLTYIASVNAITYTGATPVFVDSLRDTWQMDPQDVVRKLTKASRALLCVHVYGHPCDMKELLGIARDRDLFVIEDCAEAFGSRYQDVHVGNFGDIATYSFYGNKTITTGEGGMVVTNDRTLYERAVHFKGQGLASHREYWHDVVGYNYRMTNICAALGLAQLEQADSFLARKRQIVQWYREGLDGLPVEIHLEIGDVRHSYWMVSILVENAGHRDLLRAYLAKEGIETRPVFFPVHTMPMYASRYERHPVADDIARRGINLPSFPGLSRDMVCEIASRIRTYFATEKQLKT